MINQKGGCRGSPPAVNQVYVLITCKKIFSASVIMVKLNEVTMNGGCRGSPPAINQVYVLITSKKIFSSSLIIVRLGQVS